MIGSGPYTRSSRARVEVQVSCGGGLCILSVLTSTRFGPTHLPSPCAVIVHSCSIRDSCR